MRVTRKDHSRTLKNNLPPVPERDLIFYHWSPTKNRNQIKKLGLRINGWGLQLRWTPPYVCFSDDPIMAWQLSGKMFPEIRSWDLWLCNVNVQTSFKHYEVVTDTTVDTGRQFIKEYRVYTRVYKRDVLYVATRTI